jgi:hypothetical protein
VNLLDVTWQNTLELLRGLGVLREKGSASPCKNLCVLSFSVSWRKLRRHFARGNNPQTTVKF